MKPLVRIAGLVLFVCVASGVSQTAMPDLIVREDVLQHQWVVRDENLPSNYCSVQEGGVQPGMHRLIRFSVMTPNIGNADITVGDPNEHFQANDGLFEFAACHQHYHFRHYAKYELIDPNTGNTWRAAKRGFCMLDTDPNPAYMGQPAKSWQFRSRGAIGIPGHQGISAGWADTYRFTLGGQYFVLDGGDGQLPIPPGNYLLRITVNPPFTAALGEPCPNMDPSGFCHQLPESNYTNNVGQITVTIPDHPGRDGYGPLAGTAVPASEEDEHGFVIDKTKK